ncbi:FAR-17a/AIG1-like protein [Coniella lustricola]|uniref:FAR-17a/AIG1-like protein n=1 Tax=Coniella lustricola TaxID=2025994 RepID=A0A2T3AIW1_9PEZI|nr:FAR-17a/AIG1-like protein [Coniella lustricola]
MNLREMACTKHPLQRLASPARSISATVHLLGIASFAASFRWLFKYPSPQQEEFGGSFQFLTIIGLALAFTSMIFGFFADLTLNKTLFRAKNIVSVCSTPLEVLISILYWGISLIDKRLLFPEELQLPLLPDLGFHAMPAFMLVLDLLFFSPPWTIKFQGAVMLSTAIAFAYWAWIEYCFSYNQTYPYPIFTVLSTPQRIMLFVGSGVTCALSTMGLKWLYGKVNGIDKMQREATNPVKLD